MRAQSQELEEAKDAQKYRLWAELIDASGKKHPPGQREMEVIDYYKDPPTTAMFPWTQSTRQGIMPGSTTPDIRR